MVGEGGGEVERVIEKRKKMNREMEGGGILACVYVIFFKKTPEIFKMKFNNYSTVFPTDYHAV